MTQKIRIIDVLKGLAILGVITIHIQGVTDVSLGFFDLVLQLSVPIFMAVMGFNYAISWERNNNLKQYFLRRIKRLLPPFFVALAVSTILGILLNIPLKFGERQLVGYFFIEGSGNYFIPVIFQFVLFFPILYFIFKRSWVAALLLFAGLQFLLPIPLVNITLQYNLIRFLPFVFIGLLLSKKADWIRRHDFGFKPLEVYGKYSYHLFLAQVVFFSSIFW